MTAACLEWLLIPSGITIDIPKEDHELYCDPEKIGEVISNLVINAIQAVGEKGWITILVRVEKEKLVFEVADSGPGIPEEVLPRVFDVVFTTKEKGTGLGLFSCKTVVEQHGGTICVRNGPKELGKRRCLPSGWWGNCLPANWQYKTPKD